MDRLRRLSSNMALNIIGAIVLVLIIFSIVVSAFGLRSFTRAFRNEYTETSYHMADTAASFVNGDHLGQYLAGDEEQEYLETKIRLQTYCKKINVLTIYVIQVDQSDYGRFVSIFNPLNNALDDSHYSEWELGHKRNTTNEEYARKYKAIYEEGSPYEIVFRTHPEDGAHPHLTMMVPIRNKHNEVTAILCLQRPISEMVDSYMPYILSIGFVTLVTVMVSSLLAAAYLRRQFVEPVQKVSAEASRFARENTIKEPLGHISRYAELSDLASSIDKMETDMLEYVENLKRTTAEQERMNTELTFARRIQEESLPNEFPAFPDRSDFDLYASMTPAKAVGGDFYNFQLIDEDHLAILIGDVSGKGIPASLFMMESNIIVGSRTSMGGLPSEIIRFANDSICEHNEANMFVTLWLGIVELSTGIVTAVNAGHCDAAVCRANGEFELAKTKHNIAIGVMSGAKYSDFQIQLGKGDKLFLYTDGVPEAMDANNQMFDLDRMLDALNEHKTDSPKVILEGVRDSVDAFAADTPQFDDLTMLCLEMK